MTWLALSLVLLHGDATKAGNDPRPWRLIDQPTLHVGLRPAVYVDNEGPNGSLEVGAGATLQMTVFAL